MLIGTAVGAAAYLALIVAIYPSFRHDTSLDAMLTANPAAAAFGINGSITSPSATEPPPLPGMMPTAS